MARLEEILQYLQALKSQAVDYAGATFSSDPRREQWYKAKYGTEGYKSQLGEYDEEGLGTLPTSSETYAPGQGWKTKHPFYDELSRRDPIAAQNLPDPYTNDHVDQPPRVLEEPAPKRKKQKKR